VDAGIDHLRQDASPDGDASRVLAATLAGSHDATSCWERRPDGDLLLLAANDRFLISVGRTLTRGVGAPIREVVPSLPPEVAALMHQVLDTGEPVALDAYAMRGSDGAVRRWDIALTPVDAAPRPTLVLAMLDVTHVMQLRAQDRIKDAFVANVSHELRAPLTVILGSIGTIARGVDLPQEVRVELLEAADRQARRLGELLENLLASSRLAGAAPAVAAEDIDVRSFLHEIASTLRARAPGRTIRARSTGTPIVTSDPTLLYRVLSNLGDNALKYSDGPVSLAARTVHDTIRVEVTDRGIGIAQDDLARIFERFQQLERSGGRRVGGVGLGLYLSSRLAALLGGRIDVRSEPGVGSTFTLILPLQPQMSLLDLTGHEDEPEDPAS
jgi:signal transduction histidine kinase